MKFRVATFTSSMTGPTCVAKSALLSTDDCSFSMAFSRTSAVEAPGNMNLAGKKSHWLEVRVPLVKGMKHFTER